MELSGKTVLLVNLAATLVMVGVIWVVQIVHYPLFGRVGATSFAVYGLEHARRITYVVGPPMIVEAVTALLLLAVRPEGITLRQVWVGVALVVAVWASTFFVQVPLHNTLGGGFDDAAHRSLVLTNWVRTLAWTARGGLVLWMAAAAMR
jgi:hypothetical protein